MSAWALAWAWKSSEGWGLRGEDWGERERGEDWGLPGEIDGEMREKEE